MKTKKLIGGILVAIPVVSILTATIVGAGLKVAITVWALAIAGTWMLTKGLSLLED